jgi:serine phosphatase RsbU (regulator of sigma subunit)
MIGKGDFEYAIPFYGSRRPMLIDLAMTNDMDVDSKYGNLQREGNTLITEVFIPTFGHGGAHLWAKATPLYDAAGNLMGAIESVRDMSALRRAEKTLERSKAELRIASDIQRSFLPEHIPPIAGFDLAATSIPAMEVGGDFYDFIPGSGRLGMVIADVSGKSVPAALFMALSRTIVRANATHHERGTDVLQDANDMISADSRLGMFVTLFYGVLDENSHNLVYANAGHPPPILLRSNSDDFTSLEVTGIALGMMEGMMYEERTVNLSPGDIVVLYTDGVTEATNSDMEQYGLKRLRLIVQRSRHLSSQGILDNILEDILNFSGDQAQFDDITMIIVKANGTIGKEDDS